MVKTLFIATLSLGTVHAMAMDAKAVCESLQPVAQQIRAQLPQDIDYMTKLTGVQLFYVNNNCMLNYNYVVASRHLLDEMAAENGHNEEDNLAFLLTDEGESTLKMVFGELAGNAASVHFAPFTEIKGVKITYTHAFDNTKIKPVVSTVMDNTR